MTKLVKISLVIVILILPALIFAENIDPTNDGSQYIWGENVGWINLEPLGNGGQGAHIYTDQVTGFMWGENIG